MSVAESPYSGMGGGGLRTPEAWFDWRLSRLEQHSSTSISTVYGKRHINVLMFKNDFKLLMKNCVDPDSSEASWFWFIFLKEGNVFWNFKVAWEMKNTISTLKTRYELALLVRMGKFTRPKWVKQNRIIWATLVEAFVS